MPTTTRNFAIVLQNVKTFDAKTLVAAKIGLQRGLQYAVTISQREFLMGPRPEKLGIVTRRLLGSIVSEAEIIDNANVIGRMGSNVKYAAYHEFGYHGSVNVKSHTRTTQILTKLGIEIDGRRVIKDARQNVIGFKESKTKAASRLAAKGFASASQQVRGHSRTVNYDGRPFVTPALEKAMPVILDEIQKQFEAIK